METQETAASLWNGGFPRVAAIDAYRAALPPGEALDFPITAIDRLGVPTWSVTFWPESLPNAGGHGYGTTDAEALTSAYGELSEVVHAAAATRRLPRRRATYRELLREVGPRGVVDPVALCLEAGSPYTPDLPLEWVPVVRWVTGERVLVPIEFVAFQGADIGAPPPSGWLITPITNGLGAGPTLAHALGHGLLELLQRDGNSVNFRALARDSAIALDGVTDPETRSLLARLAAAGVEVVAKLAATDFGLTNVYVVGADRDPETGNPLMAAACGEAAHPDREVALRKAILEFAAARARLAFTHGPLGPVERVAPPRYLDRYVRRHTLAGEEERALRAMIDWTALPNGAIRAALADTVFAVRERIPFSALPTVAAPLAGRAALLDLIAGRLGESGFDILYADFSPPGYPEVRVVKAIVPGLEVETISYGRIGPRNLRRLLARGGDLVGLGDPPPGARPILLTAEARDEFGGAAWLDPVAIDRLVGPLYVLYREPGRHSAPLARADLTPPSLRSAPLS